MKTLTLAAIRCSLMFLLATLAKADDIQWKLSPISGEWFTDVNWEQANVPNQPDETAIFGLSNTISVSFNSTSGLVEIEGIRFNKAATNPYTITVQAASLGLSGTGITNNLGITQNFVTTGNNGGLHTQGHIEFSNSATAGTSTVFTNNAGQVRDRVGGSIVFRDDSTAGNGTFINSGATVSGAGGGSTIFNDSSTAGSATLIANGGTNGGLGGTILFLDDSQGGTSRVEVFGNGILDFSGHNPQEVQIGSIEGSGNVLFHRAFIDLTVGGNNMDTEFSGVIDGGPEVSLSKNGTGKLTLSGDVNVRETFILSGVLQVNGSVTNDFISVEGKGTLAGTGTIKGNVNNIRTVSPGTVNPGSAGAPGTLTIDGDYTQQSDATLMIQIAGASDGQFSVLDVMGAVNLNGTLKPVLLNFVPGVDQMFAFLLYGSREDDSKFSRIANLNFDNMHWEISYEDTRAILTAKAGAVVPGVPDQGSTFVLLTLGLLGLVTFRRQLARKQS